MTRTLTQKMGIKPNSQAFFVNIDNGIFDNLHLSVLNISTKLEGEFDYIHLFAKTQTEFLDHFSKLKPHLKPNGMLWVSWPKSGKLGTDLNIKLVIKLGYDCSLVESTCLSINDIWSGLKFTHPKKGKVYNNSYGKLNEDKTNNMKKASNLSNEVTKFLDEQNNPLRKEIELLREIILTTNIGLSENIKWNGPNYCFGDEDRITMRIQPITAKQIQLIFHRGAKVKVQPKSKLINDTSGLLLWKENDRAIATFKNIQEIKNKKSDLHKIINEWINATKVDSKTNEVDKYISEFDPEIQIRLSQIRKLFFEVLPVVQESISYKLPCYKVGKHRLYFAGYKKHIGFYPVYGLDEIEDELLIFRAKGTKDSLHFLHSEPLPVELITKIILLKSNT
jgi:uncharacterized protein YdhG (YjbR/CyaY superfamily)